MIGHPINQIEITTLYIYTSLETSAAKVNKSYSRRLPALNDFTGKLNFRYKSQPTQLKISKPSLEHSRKSPEFPNQNLMQIGPGVPEL